MASNRSCIRWESSLLSLWVYTSACNSPERIWYQFDRSVVKAICTARSRRTGHSALDLGADKCTSQLSCDIFCDLSDLYTPASCWTHLVGLAFTGCQNRHCGTLPITWQKKSSGSFAVWSNHALVFIFQQHWPVIFRWKWKYAWHSWFVRRQWGWQHSCSTNWWWGRHQRRNGPPVNNPFPVFLNVQLIIPSQQVIADIVKFLKGKAR